jgi:hypothetical protein
MLNDILAGPILRRTTDKCICVWLATDKKLDFVLEILDMKEKPIGRSKPEEFESSRIQLGSGLFVYLLKAYPNPIDGIDIFSNGVLYYYRLLNDPENPVVNLKDAGLTYGDHKYPIFHIPGKLNSILHGSCRKPHGDKGQDRLVVGDSLLEETHSNIAERPDMLLLTGDQIYADDVDASLLKVLMGQAEKIMGHHETLPRFEYGKQDKDPVIPSTIKLGARMGILKKHHSGLSSQEASNHLMGFGEFAAMYIYVFGNAQGWQIPAWSEIETSQEDVSSDKEQGKINSNVAVAEFGKSLGKVRRLLANIPTYMIFDDHDVTDDWNITGNWYDKVRSSPLGRRIVSNALAAYWAFQGWGNDPNNFDIEMIDVIKKYVNSPTADTANDEQYDLLTWKHRGWGFSVSTNPPIIAIDSRTQRQSDNAFYPARLLDRYGLDGLRLEWHKLKASKDENQLINENTMPVLIATTPVFGFAPLEHIVRLSFWCVSYIESLLLIKIIESHFNKRGIATEWFVDFVDGEAWTSNLDGFTDFLDTLLHKMNIKQCVFLSGDVHYSFTATGKYTSKNNYSRTKETLHCYQLTSSSLGNKPSASQIKALNKLEKSDEGLIPWGKIRNWFTTHFFIYRTWQVEYELHKYKSSKSKKDLDTSEEGSLPWQQIRKWFNKIVSKFLKKHNGKHISEKCNLGQVFFKEGLPIGHKLWHTKDNFVEYKIDRDWTMHKD